MCIRVRADADADDKALLPGAYLNASLIPRCPEGEAGSAFVASQAPLPSTFDAFFTHLHAQRVRVLVNLTPLEENGMVKSDVYWPTSSSAPVTTEHWTVSLESEMPARQVPWLDTQADDAAVGDMVVRRLRLAPRDGAAAAQELWQLHFVQWPDHGVLSAPALLALARVVARAQAVDASAAPAAGDDASRSVATDDTDERDDAPVWVHCSAGLGRSGTLIGVLLLQSVGAAKLAAHSAELWALYATSHMRECRPGMVQTPAQLVALMSAVEAMRTDAAG